MPTFKDPTQQAEGRAARWVNEPIHERHPSLKVHTKRPFNAEPSNIALQQLYTPKGQHYRRTHAPVPVVDEAAYRLSVSVDDGTASAFKLSLTDIKTRFKPKEVSVTLMCTGNRRGEYNKYGQTAGLPWKNGSISTAKWKGSLLKDVLNDVGIFYDDMHKKGYRFVTFWGLEDYHVSVPLSKAMDVNGDCILAFIMNNDPILRDHGAPLRVIIPGYVGARSVKWLDRIIVMKEAVEGLHQTGIAYKQFGPNWKNLARIPKDMIQECPPIDIIPVTSAVTAPDDSYDGKIQAGDTMVCKGYAYSGGGRAIVRVDVSLDDGKTWNQAKLVRAVNEDGTIQSIRSNKAWAWSQWTLDVEIPRDANMHELSICCKAIDDQYNQQPHEVEPIWNVRGILNTSWGRIKVKNIRSRL